MFNFKRENGKWVVTVNGFKAVFDWYEDAINYFLYRRATK